MLKITPPKYQFCPFSGDSLEVRVEEGKTYHYCPKCQWTYYPRVAASGVAVIVQNNQVLLVKRNREPYKGTWMFPAGFSEYGEHPQETAMREVSEEVGLVGHTAKLIDVLQVDDDTREPGILAFFYLVEASGDLQNNDQNENSEIQWHPLDNPPEIGWKSHQKIMAELHNNL